MTAEDILNQAKELLSKVVLENIDIADSDNKNWYYHLCCAQGELKICLKKLEKEYGK